jgi:hypothetical protein
MKGKGKTPVSTHGARHALTEIGGAEPSLADGVDKTGDGWVLFPEGPSLEYPP